MNDARDRLETWRLAELGKEAAGLVHQLRQPLFAIKGLLQLAEAQPLHAASHVAAARAQVESLERLVSAWADLSREPREGTEEFDIRMPVENALTLLRQRAARLGVSVVADLGPGCLVRSSELGVQQAVVNLGQNALDALEARADARLVLSIAGCEIVVRDNGPGLPDSVRDRLFVPFTTTRQEGTGLGLSLAKALIEGGGGRLTLEPQESGVCWRIVLAAAG